MAAAVANYAVYRDGPHAWALGRFVRAGGRLGRVRGGRGRLLPREPGASPGASPRCSAPTPRPTCARSASSTAATPPTAPARSRPTSSRPRPTRSRPSSGCSAPVPRYLQAYVEIPVDRDPAPLVAAIGRAGGRAKVRTGGVTADAFPAGGRPRPLHPRLPRRRRAVQGDRGPAPSAPGRVPADLRARQRLAAPCSASSTCSSPPPSWPAGWTTETAASCSRSATRLDPLR